MNSAPRSSRAQNTETPNVGKSDKQTSARCAATYVRMSADRQNYSIEHQREYLSAYASAHGLSVVREYGDEGKSGLALKGRPGLRSLLADVQADAIPFNVILVYDVSRWGRFQDADESAHYEFICRSAGVEVIYCAEQFDSDCSPMSALIKSMKRTMAAEYSRELSSKVFRAQCRFISMGFKQGGSAGYALRRQVVDQYGEHKTQLAFGQRKGSTTDRVIFVLGPQHEIDILRKIYSMYVDEHRGETEIARHLNAEGTPSEFGRPWTPWLVKSLLTNEKYLGDMVFNRGSCKLQRHAVHNPRAEWLRLPEAFPSPLPVGLFQLAQVERIRRNAKQSEDDLLQMLRDLHLEHGKVTTTMLSSEVRSTFPKLLARHFGTITNAYVLAGVPTTSTYSYVATRRFVAQTKHDMINQILVLCVQAGGHAAAGPGDDLIVNNHLRVRVVAARSRHGKADCARWKVPTRCFDGAAFVIMAQLAICNEKVQAYYLLDTPCFASGDLTMREERPEDFARYRFPSLAAVFGIVECHDAEYH